MSTSYTSHPLPAQTPPIRRRSFAGPLILILLGVLFLLGNLHVLAWSTLGYYFARWWPALIILWGVLKLVEYLIAESRGERARGIGAGGVVLLIFLIFAGLTASGVHRFADSVNWDDIGVDKDDLFFGDLFGKNYQFTQELHQEFPAGAALKVVSEHGDVTVTPWDQNDIKVSVSKKIRAENQNQAGQTDSQTRAQISINGNEVLVNANTSGAGNRAVETDLTIYVPRQGSVNIATQHGDISVTDRAGSVQANNSHGDVHLSGITGEVRISARNGSVTVSRVTGDVSFDGHIDDVNIADVSGSVNLNGDVMEELNLSRIGKQVAYHSSHTDLELASLPGDLNLQSDDLKGDEITGPLRLVTRAKVIHLDDVSGDVRIENSDGDVELHAGKLPMGNVQVTNRGADVNIVLPANAAFQVTAVAHHGEINSDFGLSISSAENESHATGNIGAGGPKLEINDEHGDVEIKKAG